MRKIEDFLVDAIKAKRSFSSGNTAFCADTGHVTLYGHTIAKLRSDVPLFSFAGYPTVTTRSRINAIRSGVYGWQGVSIAKGVIRVGSAIVDSREWFSKEKAETLEFTKIAHDSNGNPRYVCHFLNLNTQEELDRKGDDWINVSDKYAFALGRANSIGGRKFSNKQYGGGIVFQSYSLDDTAAACSRVTGRLFRAVCN